MKAVICTAYGGPEVLKLAEVKKPVPKANEVLIRISATTVTVADFRIRSFTVPASFWIPARIFLGITKPRFPVLGLEYAGVIEVVGKNVTLFKKGDKVFGSTNSTFGAYAEYKCIPENGPVALAPANIDLNDCAALPIGAGTALHYLRKANLKAGQSILIYGASGSVGTYAVQLAKYYGAHVTAVCSATNLSLVKRLGADEAIDYTAPDFVNKLGLYDVVLVAIDKFDFKSSMKVLKEEGVYLNVTTPVKTPSMIWTSITTKKGIVVGENSPEKADDLRFLKELVEQGKLKPVIDKTYTLDQIVEAHRYVDTGRKKGNVLVTI